MSFACSASLETQLLQCRVLGQAVPLLFGTPIFFTCLDASWEQRLHPEHPGPDSHEKPGPSGASLAQISEHLGATSWEGWAPLVLTSLSSSTDFVNFRLLQCKFLKRLGPCPRVSSSCCLRLQRLLADASQTLCDFSFVACFFGLRPLQVYLVCRSLVLSRWRQSYYSASS